MRLGLTLRNSEVSQSPFFYILKICPARLWKYRCERERERERKPERAAREALSGVEVLRLHQRDGRRRRRWKGWRGPLGSLAGKDLHSCTLSLLLQDLRAH